MPFSMCKFIFPKQKKVAKDSNLCILLQKFVNYLANPIVSTSNTRVEFEGMSAPLPRTP